MSEGLERQSTSWKKLLIGAAGLLFVLLAASFGGVIGRHAIRYFNPPSKATIETDINKALNEGLLRIRATLPIKVDDTITMVDASVEGLVTTYFYMLNEAKLNNTANSWADARKHVVKEVCESVMVEPMKYGARFRYVYRNTMNETLGSFEVARADCQSR